MKIISFLIPLIFLTDVSRNTVIADGPGFSVYYSVNPYLSPTAPVMYFPLSDARINLVCPTGISLGDIKIPNISIATRQIASAVTLSERFYKSYAKFVGANEVQLKAAHNMANAVIENAIVKGTIEQGCKVTVQMTFEAAKKLTGTACTASLNKAKVACTAYKALKNTVIRKKTQDAVIEGCKVTAKFVTSNIIEITLNTYYGLKNSIDEARFWLAYFNSVEGMIILMNHIY